jgi:hypothetical protein
MSVARIGVQEWKPLKRALSHIVESRRGYQSEIIKPHGEKMIDSFKTMGFINTGHTLKHETYSTTGFADVYYRDMYGVFDWTYHRVKGIIKNLVK